MILYVLHREPGLLYTRLYGKASLSEVQVAHFLWLTASYITILRSATATLCAQGLATTAHTYTTHFRSFGGGKLLHYPISWAFGIKIVKTDTNRCSTILLIS
jgi:hypothetical protein